MIKRTVWLDEEDIKYLECMREEYKGEAGMEGYTETLDRILERAKKPLTSEVSNDN